MLSPCRYLPIVANLCQTLIEVASELLYLITEKSACIGVIAIILIQISTSMIIMPLYDSKQYIRVSEYTRV
jgi:hypothetical protein